MTSHTFECTYQLTGSEFATLHEELKKFGSYYFENRPKMAYENKKTDKITKYVCTITAWYYNLYYTKRNDTINICTHANL